MKQGSSDDEFRASGINGELRRPSVQQKIAIHNIQKLEENSKQLMKQYQELQKIKGSDEMLLLQIRNEYLVNEIDISNMKIKEKVQKQNQLNVLIDQNKKLIEDGNFYESNKNKIQLKFNQNAYESRDEKIKVLNKKLSEDKEILDHIQDELK